MADDGWLLISFLTWVGRFSGDVWLQHWSFWTDLAKRLTINEELSVVLGRVESCLFMIGSSTIFFVKVEETFWFSYWMYSPPAWVELLNCCWKRWTRLMNRIWLWHGAEMPKKHIRIKLDNLILEFLICNWTSKNETWHLYLLELIIIKRFRKNVLPVIELNKFHFRQLLFFLTADEPF